MLSLLYISYTCATQADDNLTIKDEADISLKTDNSLDNLKENSASSDNTQKSNEKILIQTAITILKPKNKALRIM